MKPPYLIVWTGPGGQQERYIAWTIEAARVVRDRWTGRIFRLQVAEEVE